jgi:hypothetical protein
MALIFPSIYIASLNADEDEESYRLDGRPGHAGGCFWKISVALENVSAASVSVSAASGL